MTSLTDAPARTTAAPKGRVALSVALLVGFYVLGAVVVVTCLFVNWVIWSAGRIQFGVLIGSAVAIFGVVRGVFTAGSKFKGLPGSVEITANDQPALFAEIADVAQEMEMEMPDRVFVVHDVNAFVLEDTRFLGLLTKQRIMGIGLPLLDAFTIDQMRGVIAHEFGHYAGNDTRLAPVVYRGRESIVNTLRTVGGGVVGSVYVAYFKLYLRASMKVSRQQELTADEWSVRVAGTTPTIDAQERLGALGSAFASFLDRYVGALLTEGHRPLNMFDGFRNMVADPENAEAMEDAATAALAESADRYDSHPSARERIDHVRALPRIPAHGSTNSAASLLRNRRELEIELSQAFVAAVWHDGALTPIDWADAGPVLAASIQPVAHEFNVLSSMPTSSAAITSFLSSSVEERRQLAFKTLETMSNAQDINGPLRFYLGASVGEMLVNAGTHRWVVSWSNPVTVAPIDGETGVDIWALAAGVTAGDAAAEQAVSQLVAVATSPSSTRSQFA